MQTYQCYICKRLGDIAGSKCYGGMFFKLCAECMDDEEAMRQMNEYWEQLENSGECQISVEQIDLNDTIA